MTFKKLLIILTITVSLMITALLGTSYAWYQFDDAVSSFNNVNTFNEELNLDVIFQNNENVNSTIGTPIFKEQVSELSHKTNFAVKPKKEELANKNIAYQIVFTDIKISEILTETSYLKYSLIEVGKNEPIKSGDFENFTGDTLILREMAPFESLDVTYNYEFRIWLQDNDCTIEEINDPNDSCKSQNDLMGKKISGKIKVLSALN